MRFRLIASSFLLTTAGAGCTLALLGAAWPVAVAGGAVAGIIAGASSALAIVPLIRRIEALATTLRGAARASPASSYVAGEDELETADLTFNELSSRWSARADQLAKETRILTAVLDGMAEGVWVTGLDGTIVRHNAALVGMLPPGQTVQGQRPLSLIRSTELNEAVLTACRDRRASRLEVQVEGSRPATLSVQVMPLGHGLEGSAAVFRDVTALRRLEKVRKDFVANVSHELRTPITAIRGYAETLRGGALSDPEHAPRMVEIIHRQSERLAALVADLLELSRLEGGDSKFERVALPLAEIVARATEVVRPRAEEKQLAVVNSVGPAVTVKADARALEQVLLNLLDNAVKYTPPGGRVEVTSEPAGQKVAVVVSDTGIGVEAQHQARIFERFYRVDPGRSRETGGTGLGLSIVKHLAGAMGGEVRVSSQPGEGSRFSVLLPS